MELKTQVWWERALWWRRGQNSIGIVVSRVQRPKSKKEVEDGQRDRNRRGVGGGEMERGSREGRWGRKDEGNRDPN